MLCGFMKLGMLQHLRRDCRTALEWGEPYSKFSFGEEYCRIYGRKSHFTAPLKRNRQTQFLTVYLNSPNENFEYSYPITIHSYLEGWIYDRPRPEWRFENCLKDKVRYLQLLSKLFIDSDFCHNYLHTLYLFECLL